MTLIVATLATSHAGAPEQCGDVPSSAPIVALNDVNPSSDTYGQTIDTSQFLGGMGDLLGAIELKPLPVAGCGIDYVLGRKRCGFRRRPFSGH